MTWKHRLRYLRCLSIRNGSKLERKKTNGVCIHKSVFEREHWNKFRLITVNLVWIEIVEFWRNNKKLFLINVFCLWKQKKSLDTMYPINWINDIDRLLKLDLTRFVKSWCYHFDHDDDVDDKKRTESFLFLKEMIRQIWPDLNSLVMIVATLNKTKQNKIKIITNIY